MRRLRPEQLEDLYESKLRPTDGTRPLAPKSVLEIHVVIRGALNDAVQRGYVRSNVALIAKAPRQRPAEEQTAWSAEQLATFLRYTAGHKYFAAIWTAAFTGLRRSELLGLKWSDLNVKRAKVSINRGRLDVNYQVLETPDITPQIGASRGKTKNARRPIGLDPTTLAVLTAWGTWQTAERSAARPRTDRVDVHRPARSPDPPPGDVANLRTDRAPRASPHDPVPRPAPHPRNAHHGRRRPTQGRLRTTRPLAGQLHRRRPQARTSRHANRRRPTLRDAHRRPDFYRRNPVEDPEGARLNTVESRAHRPGFPEIIGSMVAGAGFEPATFGL